MGDLERAPWRESTPEEAADWLRRVPCRWWLAGGWAIERFVGSAIRRHGDLDVGCLRRDAAALTSALTGWEFYGASDGRLTPVRPGTAPEPRFNSLWARPVGHTHWRLELLLDECDGTEWLFRREPSVRRPLVTITWRDAAGISVLQPEIQLLYKAKSARPCDEQDFERTRNHLDPEARAWLRLALSRVHPSHRWLPSL